MSFRLGSAYVLVVACALPAFAAGCSIDPEMGVDLPSSPEAPRVATPSPASPSRVLDNDDLTTRTTVPKPDRALPIVVPLSDPPPVAVVPTTVLAGAQKLGAFAVFKNEVYFRDGLELRAVPLQGGAARDVAHLTDVGQDLVVGDRGLYYTRSTMGGVARVDLGTGDSVVDVLTKEPTRALVADAASSRLFWLQRDEDGHDALQVRDERAETTRPAYRSEEAITSFSVSGHTALVALQSGRLLKIDVDGDTPARTVVEREGIAAVGENATHVFWVAASRGTNGSALRAFDKRTERVFTAALLPTLAGQDSNIVVDGNAVYVTHATAAGHALLRVEELGGSITGVAVGATAFGKVQVTRGLVLWTLPDSGNLFSVPR